MTKAEKIDKLRGMTKAYILYGVGTRLPFVECEQGNYFDQTFLYESKEEAEEAAKRFGENGDMVGVLELKVVEMVPPRDEKLGEPIKNLMRNQIREHLMRFPLLGLNAVFFKPAGESGEVLELDLVLPDEVKEYVEKEKTDLIGVQLTGLYLAQSLHRREKDMKQLRERSEEFHANLVRAALFMPVIPDEKQPEGGNLNLATSKIPSFPIKKKDSEEVSSFLALFTNMDELAAYCRRISGQAQVVRVPFQNLPNIIQDPMIGCVIDPLSVCLPVSKEDIPKLVEAFKA